MSEQKQQQQQPPKASPGQGYNPLPLAESIFARLVLAHGASKTHDGLAREALEAAQAFARVVTESRK